MEKIKFNLVAAFAAICILFTSCLSDSGDTETRVGFGFVKADTYGTNYLIYGLTKAPVTSSAFTTAAAMNGWGNKFVLVSIEVDYDSEVNQGYQNKGYALAAITADDIVEDGYVYPYVQETPKENEVVPTAIELYGVLENQLLLYIDFKNYTDKDQVTYSIEFDREVSEKNTYNGYNIYDVYLRLTHIPSETGKTITKPVQFNIREVANNFKNYESSSSEFFLIRINYASSIDEETEEIKWTAVNQNSYFAIPTK